MWVWRFGVDGIGFRDVGFGVLFGVWGFVWGLKFEVQGGGGDVPHARGTAGANGRKIGS